ncbi:MAG: MBL fold metallo-hydrolase [Gammaproteobacteria bacterium]|nr:MBL fold metallo-hydrolase [Gammaproteobacteria bacterium]
MSLNIADRWFDRKTIDSEITLLWEPHVSPFLRCNIWHVKGRERDMLVDTGLGVVSLRQAARDLFEKPVTAVATHIHYDHVGGLHEFDTRLLHAAEADLMGDYREFASLRSHDLPQPVIDYLDAACGRAPDLLIEALPYAGFEPGSYTVTSTRVTRTVAEGDVIDLGNRCFEVLHLPGHSPGSIGLWEACTGTLFSGDAVYDGTLLDTLPESDVAAYIASMKRLRELPVTVVHGGHEPSFGRGRLRQLADAYLAENDI